MDFVYVTYGRRDELESLARQAGIGYATAVAFATICRNAPAGAWDF
jgi:hypothetical protein